MLTHSIAFTPPTPPTPLDDDYKVFIPTTKHEKIPALFYDAGSDNVIIFSHGNACDLGQTDTLLRKISDALGISILGYEYLGYGFADSIVDSLVNSCSSIKRTQPTEVGCYRSIMAAHSYLIRQGFKDQNIILMGQSIGTGPTTELAMIYPDINSVILVSPYKSIASVVSDNWFVKFIADLFKQNIFTNEEKMPFVRAPILFLHGVYDTVIDHKHSEYLYAKRGVVGYDKLCLLEATHNNILTVHFDTVMETIRNFIGKSEKRI